MKKLKFSYFQLTFGQDETYLHPEKTYERLKKFGYDAKGTALISYQFQNLWISWAIKLYTQLYIDYINAHFCEIYFQQIRYNYIVNLISI